MASMAVQAGPGEGQVKRPRNANQGDRDLICADSNTEDIFAGRGVLYPACCIVSLPNPHTYPTHIIKALPPPLVSPVSLRMPVISSPPGNPPSSPPATYSTL